MQWTCDNSQYLTFTYQGCGETLRDAINDAMDNQCDSGEWAENMKGLNERFDKALETYKDDLDLTVEDYLEIVDAGVDGDDFLFYFTF